MRFSCGSFSPEHRIFRLTARRTPASSSFFLFSIPTLQLNPMKTNLSLFGSVSALLVATVFLQGCRTYQPGVSTRRTLFSSPEQSYTPSAQPAPAAVRTAPAAVKSAPEPATPVSSPKAASFAPVAVGPKQSSAVPSVQPARPVQPSATAVVPVVPVSPAVSSQPVHTLNYKIHTVQPGEFAGKIANDNGMTLKEFTELNKLSDPNRLRVGQTVKVAVGRKALAAGPATPAPSVSIPGKVHIVAPGESLSVIAARTGVPEKELVAINGIKDPNRIRVGQKLRLTRSDAPAVVAPAPATPKTVTPVVAPAPATPKAVTPVVAPAVATPKAVTPVVAPVAALPVAGESKKEELVPGTNASVEDLLNGKVSLLEARTEAEKKAQDAKAAADKLRTDAESLTEAGLSGVKTREYIVERPDEDLYSIALKFGTTVYELRKHNPTLSRKPAVGTKVIIPEKTDL